MQNDVLADIFHCQDIFHSKTGLLRFSLSSKKKALTALLWTVFLRMSTQQTTLEDIGFSPSKVKGIFVSRPG